VSISLGRGTRPGTVPGVNLRNFRYLAIVEATSFLLLLGASVVKRTEDEALGVEILGPIHGGLFIAYVVVALSIRQDLGWTTKTTLLVLLGAVVPFGGYVVDRWLARNHPDEPATAG
jgi:integral membrane protein